MKTFDELNKEMDTFKKEFQEKGKGLFNEILQSIWEEYPEVNSFGWTQYTPYFNDGDECTFGVNEVRWINGFEEYNDENKVCNENIWSRYSYKEKNRESEIVKGLTNFIQSAPSDVLKALFGDHTQVTVNRDGSSKVEEYEHD